MLFDVVLIFSMYLLMLDNMFMLRWCCDVGDGGDFPGLGTLRASMVVLLLLLL